MHVQSLKLIPDTMFSHGQARHSLSSSPPPPPRHSPPAVLSDQSGMPNYNLSCEQDDLRSASWPWRHSAALELGMSTSVSNLSTPNLRHEIREYDFLRCIDDASEMPPEPESDVDCTLHLGVTSTSAQTSSKLNPLDCRQSKSGKILPSVIPLRRSARSADIVDDRVNHTGAAKLDVGNAALLQSCWTWSCTNQNNQINNYNNNNSGNSGGGMMMASLLRENVPAQDNGAGGGTGSRTSSNSSSAGSAVNPPSAAIMGTDKFSRDPANLSGWAGSHLYGLGFTPGHNRHHHQRLLSQANQAVTSGSYLSGLLSATQRPGPINVSGLFDLTKSSPAANFSRSLHHNAINSSVAAATNAHQHNHSYSYSRAKEASSYVIRICAQCKTMRTPLWRNGPQGPKSLCNACGIRYKKEERRSAAAAAAAAKEADLNKRQPSDGSKERSRLMDTTTTSEGPYLHQSEKRLKLANNSQ